ncbi:hypothetical protein RF11_11825 [Thelohanellus kitauei]|uniref:Uncharacterized protein n=1 Tax=Thelohanellus kitauei TaxID=669202 RepID=A0A0C2IYB7_THEKT|nr:hypothetical protein RF11_11825 [Thelohanellus kitauei]
MNHNTTKIIKFILRPMIFARPDYLFMKIDILYIDKSNLNHIGKDTVYYHLFFVHIVCNESMEISYANHHNVKIMFLQTKSRSQMFLYVMEFPNTQNHQIISYFTI